MDQTTMFSAYRGGNWPIMKSNMPRCIAVVGLGYVGLPLASAFGKVVSTIGFDVNERRIRELRKGIDRNGDMTKADLL